MNDIHDLSRHCLVIHRQLRHYLERDGVGGLHALASRVILLHLQSMD